MFSPCLGTLSLSVDPTMPPTHLSSSRSEETLLLPSNVQISSTPKWKYYLSKVWKWSNILLIQGLYIPLLAYHVLRELVQAASDGAQGFLFFLLVLLTIVLPCLWALWPVLLFYAAWTVFHYCDLVFEALLKSKRGRLFLRLLSLTILCFNLWYFVDLRPAFRASEYSPLSQTIPQIRLVELHPATKHWEIKVTLRPVSLADNPSFEAISYAWGDPARTKTIIVNGKRLAVTENLEKALRNIRYEKDVRMLWIDAISINQHDSDEKSQQLPLMSLIYRRARRVLVSLGNHAPPRWVAHQKNWDRDMSLAMAKEYWETTEYWLFQLSLEEYWKRCWIVQEIGEAVDIQVYYGRQAVIPWNALVRFMSLLQEKRPRWTTTARVLRLEELRETMYSGRETYTLSQLLGKFRDSFCSVSLDKVLAFTGMAVDCQGDCLPIDYTAGPRPLYEATVAFYNSSTKQNEDAGVEMVYFAGLVRWLLSRQQVQVTNEYSKPGFLYQPDSWTYWLCGDDLIEWCVAIPEILIVTPLLEYLRAPFSAFRNLFVKTSFWLPDVAEDKHLWESGADDAFDNFRAVGFIAGEIQEIGPSYADYLGVPHVPHQWSALLSARYPREPERRRARGLDARLSALLGPAADHRLGDIAPLPALEGQVDKRLGGARLFLGGQDIIMGLIPSNSQVGDRLCQFWNSSSVAILRPRQNGSERYDVIGRGAMVQHGDEVDWDIPTDRNIFLSHSSEKVVELNLSLRALNHLSFDIVNSRS